MTQARSRSKIILELICFLLGTFVPFTALGMLAAKAGGLAHMPLVTPLGMLTPMLSAFLVQKLVARQPILGPDGLGFQRGKLWWWVLAPVAFALMVAATMLLSFAVTPDLLALKNQVISNIRNLQFIPKSLSVTDQLVFAVAISVFVGPLLNLPIFLGEEVGWRGFMNPRLIALFGRPGVIAGGVIWALWHIPIILIGHNYPQHPWLGLLVWIPTCVCLNILLQAVRQLSGSIFPSAVAHGVINQLGTLSFALFAAQSKFIDVLHGPAGLTGLLVFLIPALLVYKFVLSRNEPRII